MTDLTPSDIQIVSPGYWASFNEIKLQTGVYSMKNHEYLIEPMDNDSRRECCMKGTQGGYTEKEVLRSLHGMRYGHYPQGVLYMFPTTDDVVEFSKSRFNPLILANRTVIGKYVKKTDTASLKKINEAFLYLRGARLSQKVGPNSDVDESSKLRGIPVDKVVFDELDLMSDEVRTKAIGRMGHSLVKEERYLSNPTIPDFGIDKMYQMSDQRHWFRRCTCCNTWTCAELSFPDCVKIRNDGSGYIGCSKCGKEVKIWNGDGTGEWVPAQRENTDYMRGYQWSQLTSVFSDPAEILSEYINPPDGNLGDVVRLRLGLPYIAAEDRLTVSGVLACCGPDLSLYSHQGPCAMGVDVGKIKHVIIGIRTGKERYEILKTVKVSEWEDIHDLAKKFNVRSAVIDIRPYEDMARSFQKAEKYRIYLCEYVENATWESRFDEHTKVVKVYRTGIFDRSHRVISEERLKIPRNCPEIKEFAVQVCNTAKVLETNKRTGTSVYRYKKLGPEHFRNALNYFLLAASGGKVAKVSTSNNNRPKKVINEYVRT